MNGLICKRQMRKKKGNTPCKWLHLGRDNVGSTCGVRIRGGNLPWLLWVVGEKTGLGLTGCAKPSSCGGHTPKALKEVSSSETQFATRRNNCRIGERLQGS